MVTKNKLKLERGHIYPLKHIGLCEFRGYIKDRNSWAFERSTGEYVYIQDNAIESYINHRLETRVVKGLVNRAQIFKNYQSAIDAIRNDIDNGSRVNLKENQKTLDDLINRRDTEADSVYKLKGKLLNKGAENDTNDTTTGSKEAIRRRQRGQGNT